MGDMIKELNSKFTSIENKDEEAEKTEKVDK
jgi:hypothetical protein